MATLPSDDTVAEAGPTPPQRKKDRTHWLYIMVIITMYAGAGISSRPPRGR